MQTAEILQEALKLPPEARAALVNSLLESLDDAVDEDAEREWDIEIARRMQEIDEGRAHLVPWSEARRRIIGG